jgi:hypothetical protein
MAMYERNVPHSALQIANTIAPTYTNTPDVFTSQTASDMLLFDLGHFEDSYSTDSFNFVSNSTTNNSASSPETVDLTSSVANIDINVLPNAPVMALVPRPETRNRRSEYVYST